MSGYILYNGFWNPKQPPDPVQRLTAAARRQGWQLMPLPHTMLLADIGSEVQVAGFSAADTVLFWDKDVRLAAAMEKAGARVLNSARAIALCDDKTLTHLTLAGLDIPTPETVLCPHSFPAVGYPQVDFLRAAGESLGFPQGGPRLLWRAGVSGAE